MRKLMSTLSAVAILGSTGAALADPPSPEALKSVWDFFEHGKGQGPVLGESKLCLDVAKSGDAKGECSAEVPATGVKSGTTVYLWQAYMVPQGDEISDLTVQIKQGDVIRETKDVGLIKGTYWRERTWSVFTPRKPGSYVFNIMRGDKVLKSYTLAVQ